MYVDGAWENRKRHEGGRIKGKTWITKRPDEFTTSPT